MSLQNRKRHFSSKEAKVEISWMKTWVDTLRKILFQILVIQTNNSSDTWNKKRNSEALPWSGLSRFTDERLLNQHRTYQKEQLCFCPTFLVLCISRCTHSSIQSLSRAASNSFSKKLKISTNTWTASKALILHQGNEMQHLHRSEIILSRESRETRWGMNVSKTFSSTQLFTGLSRSSHHGFYLNQIIPTIPTAFGFCFLQKKKKIQNRELHLS